MQIVLPQMLEKYSSIYNKNGRIGIYTREVDQNLFILPDHHQERDVIINRFYEKRKKRVWKKKIRYHCRKNLADSRVRVKGRFVKHNTGGDDEDSEDDPDDTNMTDALGILLKATQCSGDLAPFVPLSTPPDYLLYLTSSLSPAVPQTIPPGAPSSRRSKRSLSPVQELIKEEQVKIETQPKEDKESEKHSHCLRSRKRMRRHSIAY